MKCISKPQIFESAYTWPLKPKERVYRMRGDVDCGLDFKKTNSKGWAEKGAENKRSENQRKTERREYVKKVLDVAIVTGS